jgi:hypothetical protein
MPQVKFRELRRIRDIIAIDGGSNVHSTINIEVRRYWLILIRRVVCLTISKTPRHSEKRLEPESSVFAYS